MNTPTPRPWKVWPMDGMNILQDDGKGDASRHSIARALEVKDAAFIVRAVNAHEELLAALKETLSELQWTSKNGQFPGMDGTIENAKQAIFRAEGRE